MKTGVVYKNIGETPLEALQRFRFDHVILHDVPLAYAGRLDPMAEGKILVLVGDECKQVEFYRNLDKEYEVEILLGVRTDTADVLGVATLEDIPELPPTVQLKRVLKGFIGRFPWPFPPYSSKPVNGKPLFVWALEGKLHEIEIPKTDTRIHELEYLGVDAVHSEKLMEYIEKKISLITTVTASTKVLGNDFRRKEILLKWHALLKGTDMQFPIVRIRVVSGSGAYMRTLSEKVGHALGSHAVALSIKRTKIGRRRSLLGLVHFWWPRW